MSCDRLEAFGSIPLVVVILLVYYKQLSPTSTFATKSRVANQLVWQC
jgi:hypothetical protein